VIFGKLADKMLVTKLVAVLADSVTVALASVADPGTVTSIKKLLPDAYVAEPPATLPVTVTTPATFLINGLNCVVEVLALSYLTYNVPAANVAPPPTGSNPCIAAASVAYN